MSLIFPASSNEMQATFSFAILIWSTGLLRNRIYLLRFSILWTDTFFLGAIQVIRDTLGGGYPKCHQISQGGGVFGKNVVWQFLLVLSLVKVNKI